MTPGTRIYGGGLYCGLAAFATLASAPVTAQDQDAANAPTPLAEIVVTAQRRLERAQDVPISISVVSGDDLEKAAVDRTEQALDLVSGLQFENHGINQSNLFVRGVGTALTDGGVESAVAMYVDDVYIGSPLAFNVSLFDAERVEVLRGPQGTLYGKNALGGALKFYSQRPQAVPSGKVEASFGNYDYRLLRGTLNMPLAEGKVLTRFSLVREEREGIYRNEYQFPGIEKLDSRDSIGVRGQVEFSPSEAWTVSVAGDWGRDKPIQAAEGKSELEDVLRTRVQRSTYAFTENRDLWGASVKVTRTGAATTFSAISAYRDMVGDYEANGDLLNRTFSTDLNTDFHQFSQELRLSSAGDRRLQWTTGLFYYRDAGRYNVPFGLVTLAEPFGYPFGYEETSDATLDTESFAAFGDMTFAFNDQWSLSAGMRYGNERRSLEYSHGGNVSDAELQEFIDSQYGAGSGLTPDLFRFAPFGTHTDDLNDNDFSPRLVLSYKPSQGLHYYASIASGAKSGSFNTLFVLSDSQFAFGSEKVWSYELGMKSIWLEDRLGLDLAAYYTQWKDQQVRTLVPEGPSFVLLIDNAGRSRIRGADLTLSARPFHGLRLSLAYSYVDAIFTDYSSAQSGDLTGNRLPKVPRHSGSAMIDYTLPLNDRAALNIHVDTNRRSSAFSDDVNDPRFEAGPRGSTNASVGVDFGRWETRLWARNVFDQGYILRSAEGITGRTGAYNLPRTYGMRVAVNFE